MAQVKELARHELPPLPYDFAALEPYIDAQTMQIHHGKHHQAYITNLNNALAKHPELAERSLEELLRGLNSVPDDIRTAVRNNGGGHHNHSLFWTILAPASKGGGGEPSGTLADAIKRTFGDFTKFKEQLSNAATSQFGSGWAWLTVSNGKLGVAGRPNQDSPLYGQQDPHSRPRCLGACLLPEVPEPPGRVRDGVVEGRKLGGSRTPLRSGAIGARATPVPTPAERAERAAPRFDSPH